MPPTLPGSNARDIPGLKIEPVVKKTRASHSSFFSGRALARPSFDTSCLRTDPARVGHGDVGW